LGNIVVKIGRMLKRQTTKTNTANRVCLYLYNSNNYF
jgi:hypothetical protein